MKLILQPIAKNMGMLNYLRLILKEKICQWIHDYENKTMTFKVVFNPS